MTLIIEDGSGISDAQSYGNAADLRSYAKLRGIALPSSDGPCEILLIAAMERLEAVTDYVGQQKTYAQALQWPRVCAWAENFPIGESEIPPKLIYAQYAYACEASAGTNLLPTIVGNESGQVLEESVGEVSVTYANTGRVLAMPAVAKADSLLRTLRIRSGLTVVRT